MFFITEDNDLKLDSDIYALYFYASWMPHHKKMVTMISKIEEKYKNIKFYAIDVDYFKSLCKRFGVDSVPTVIVKKNDKEVKRITGLVLTSAFKSAFSDIC